MDELQNGPDGYMGFYIKWREIKMQKIEKDDIIIRKGIIHILDSHNGYLGLSNDLLDMGPDLMEFVRGHIFKILDSDDTKKCKFDGSLSPIPALLED